MTQTRKFAVSAKLAVPALLAVAAALLIAPGGAAAGGTSACPTFRVLGNDRIGPAVLPKGTYSMKVFGSNTLAPRVRLFRACLWASQ